MANKAKFQAIKGTRDLLPPETELWNRVEATAREVFSTYGYGEIRPPIFEPTELFARAVGGETDIVSKEMYTMDNPDTSHIAGLQSVLKDWEINQGNVAALETLKGLTHALIMWSEEALKNGGLSKDGPNPS